jgi:hypothetical protein
MNRGTIMSLLSSQSLLVLALATTAACTSGNDESTSASTTTSGESQPGLGRTAPEQEGEPSKQVSKPAPSEARPKLTRSATWLEGGEERKLWISDELVVEFEPAPEGEVALHRTDPGATEVPQRQEGVRIWRVTAAAGTENLARDANSERARFSPVLHATESPDSPKSALPGGVLVTFPADWDRARIDTWLAEHGRAVESEVGDGLHTYLVPTAPGLAALDACNELARADERVSCEPNWWREPSTR